eukprot:SAG31_NODE_16325_length_713_cov_1.328990_2_plen_79_part_00
MDWAACSPLRFIKLFRTRTQTILTIARGTMECMEFISIYDINFLFFTTAMAWQPSNIGYFVTWSVTRRLTLQNPMMKS